MTAEIRHGRWEEVLAGSGRALVVRGDCMDLGSVIPDGSIDALVTDPPSGISFMGKGWDGTLVAALDEGFRVVGCELDEGDEYMPILLGRVTEALGRHKQIDLFGGAA